MSAIRAIFLCFVFSSSVIADDLIWIEGETGSGHDLDRNAWWEAVRPSGLSAGDMVASFSEWYEWAGWVQYEIDIPRDGNYHIWFRVGRGTGYTYQVDEGRKTEIDASALKETGKDRRNLALDGETDARYYLWLPVEQARLHKGIHTLKVWLGGTKSKKRFGAIDAIVLTTGEFTPNGPYKPGQTNPFEVAYPAEDMWTFEATKDDFSTKSLLDLRHLNEDVAGKHGFIGLSEDKMSFVRGDGTPIRFWGGTESVQGRLNKIEELKSHAEFLAKRGVNLVRWHGRLPDNPNRREREQGRTTELTDVDEEELDEAFKLVATMKESGIYSVLSPYWGTHTKIEDNWKLPDPENDNLAGLVFWVPEVRDAYKGYLRALYTTPNPYTGIPLKDDPAVAIIQLQNEDSLLFYTMSAVKGEPRVMLRRLYLEWLTKKYGTPDDIKKAWSDYSYNHFGPDWENGLPELMHPWEFTREGIADKGHVSGFLRRRADQVEFFSRTMRQFNMDMAEFLREELGCRQLINAGNWRTVDQFLVDDAERWSYTANEVIAKNHYFASFHSGANRGWQILEDSIFTNRSAILSPNLFPVNVRQVVGHPFIISESLWVPPNLFQAEAPLLVAAQQSLTGVDALLWYKNYIAQWSEPVGGRSLHKWSYNSPTVLGQFPAAALIFRKNLLQQGDPVIVERRTLDQIWDETPPIIAEPVAFDPNRDQGDNEELKLEGAVDPLAFLVGPVYVQYVSKEAESTISDFESFIDRDNKTVRSNTGELSIDYGRGIYRVMAPRVQAAAGHLALAGSIDLGDVRISSRDKYAVIAVVSMDDRPISQSTELLVQVGTFARPTGWLAERIEIDTGSGPQEAFRVIDVGTAPWQVRRSEATITVNNPSLTTAVILDANGTPIRSAAIDTQREIPLPSDALYVILR
jgi:hypothetical protein